MIKVVTAWKNLPKYCIFDDFLLIVSYVSAVLKLLFYNDIEQMKPLSFFCLSASDYVAMLLPETLPRFGATTFSFLRIFSWIFLNENFLKTLNSFFQKNVRSVRFQVIAPRHICTSIKLCIKCRYVTVIS